MTMPAFAETDYVANYGIKEDIPGICSYASIDAKDYTGHEITILTHAVPVMGEPGGAALPSSSRSSREAPSTWCTPPSASSIRR